MFQFRPKKGADNYRETEMISKKGNHSRVFAFGSPRAFQVVSLNNSQNEKTKNDPTRLSYDHSNPAYVQLPFYDSLSYCADYYNG